MVASETSIKKWLIFSFPQSGILHFDLIRDSLDSSDAEIAVCIQVGNPQIFLPDQFHRMNRRLL